MNDGRARVVVDNVYPEFECGRFPIKRSAGEEVTVKADVYADGHDVVACSVLYRKEDAQDWQESPMISLPNDRWSGQFRVPEVGRYIYSVRGWIDPFQSWRRDLRKRIAADQDTDLDYLAGSRLVGAAAKRAGSPPELKEQAELLNSQDVGLARKRETALDESLEVWMERLCERRHSTTYEHELPVQVDPARARFSSWYEFFPRSCSPVPGEHGTFKGCGKMLDYVASMGFDTVYLPPVHPIGGTHRKGRNNNTVCEPDEVGSPWAIGAAEGGHTAIHPQLGTAGDFRGFLTAAEKRGLAVAMDIAFQCSPDHPWVTEHPEWFRKRPDGSIQYAENPPKKYEDIYPIDFETEDWQGLWEGLKNVFLHWSEMGVAIFRVDNPHTKAFRFWEWVIREVKNEYPATIFLAEAFTRPAVMYRLAKLGFTQSYTYFTWRNTKQEITEYMSQLTQTEIQEFFTPHLWPNTPDILPEYLQFGGRSAFVTRLVLAATLSGNYGIYGPAFELWERAPREPGSEEYLNSEKYEIKQWDLDRGDSLKDVVARVNSIRKSNQALQSTRNLHFHRTDNDQLICYSKRTDDFSNIVLVVANLDPHHRQSGYLELDLEELGLEAGHSYQAHDLLTEARYLWQGARNYVELDPEVTPAHVMAVRRRVRTEKHFDYFM